MTRRTLIFGIVFSICLTSQALAGKYTSLIATQAAIISIEKVDVKPEPGPPPVPKPDIGAVGLPPPPKKTTVKQPTYSRSSPTYTRRGFLFRR